MPHERGRGTDGGSARRATGFDFGALGARFSGEAEDGAGGGEAVSGSAGGEHGGDGGRRVTDVRSR